LHNRISSSNVFFALNPFGVSIWRVPQNLKLSDPYQQLSESEDTPVLRNNATFAFSVTTGMSHPFELLLSSARAAGFTDGLRAGRQSVEKKLIDLQKYVGQLEGQLRKEGNWRVTMVTKSQSDDFGAVREQRVNTQQQIRNSIPRPVVAFAAPTLVTPPIRSANTRNVSHLHSNPWGSISRRRCRHFRSRIHASQSDFHLQNTNHTRYIIPPLRPVTDFMSSSLSFPARLFSRFWDRDEGVATREGGTWVSGLRVPGILGSVGGPGSV
jgi:hypothetical protein